MLQSRGMWLSSAWFVIASLCVIATAAVPVPRSPLHRHVSAKARNGETEHQYFDEYDVPRKFLKRKSGITKGKSELIQKGHVFFAMGLRPLVSDAKGQFRADFNFDHIAVCQGHITGLNMQNQTAAFRLFACPTDEVQAAQVTTVRHAVQDGIQMFCCHDPPSQRCCSREEFYRTYGSHKEPPVPLATKLFLVICILMVFTIFVACIALIVCCCAVLPPLSLRGKKPKHQRSSGTMRPLFSAASQQQNQQQNQQLQPHDYGATNLSFSAYTEQFPSLPHQSQLQQQQQQQQSPMHPSPLAASVRYPTINLPENQQLQQQPVRLHLAPRYP